jgi:probable HAF family extracellular repeat protein
MFSINAKSIKHTITIFLGSVSITGTVLLAPVKSASPPVYSVVDLGTLPGDDVSISTAINDSGQVVGYSVRYADFRFRAFLWEKGVMKELGTLGGNGSLAWDINDSGQIVGGSDTGKQDLYGSDLAHAFLWTKMTAMIDLTPDVGNQFTRAEGINNAGEVILSQDNKGFLLKNGMRTELCRQNTCAFPYDINNSSSIVGTAEVVLGKYCYSGRGGGCTVNAVTRAHLWDQGNLINLGTIGDAKDINNYSMAVAINDQGQIVGEANNKCVLWENKDSIVELGALGDRCIALDINNNGWVVARTDDYRNNGESRALLWYKHQGLRDLNNLIPANSGWVLNEARSINKAGQITGYGTINGNMRAFVLQPSRSSQMNFGL